MILYNGGEQVVIDKSNKINYNELQCAFKSDICKFIEVDLNE